jgi:rfaE bifunctional protein kinase chain/domain
MTLTPDHVEHVLGRLGGLSVGVVGDLFLDRYLDLDGTLTEPSIETGLDAYQVADVRPMPGAAGTVINNLVALGVGRVCPVAVVGDDGEGYELRRALTAMGVRTAGLVLSKTRRTPTYTKPMLCLPGQPPRELNRLDIHPRQPLPAEDEAGVIEALQATLRTCDAVAVLDQVSRPECGVITTRVREEVRRLAGGGLVLADSRERIGLFRETMLKPNERECLAACPGMTVEAAAQTLAERTYAPVFVTRGERGILLAFPGRELTSVPGYAVSGPVDPVGAGDSTTAGILCALAAGLMPEQAAAFGCLVASITVRKIGTTGTASPEELRARIREVG